MITDPVRVTAFRTRRPVTGRPANLRDLGGTRTHDGYRVRAGVLYRSDAPQPHDPRSAREVGLPATAAWPPATVVDLRSHAETTPPHPMADIADVRQVPLGESPTPARVADAVGQEGPARAYRLLADEAGNALADVLRLVAGAPGPVLVHCVAGTDRTGLAIGVLLAALGVPRATIVEDHLRTDDDRTTPWARLRAAGQPERDHDALLGVDATAPETTALETLALETVLDDLDAHPGGVHGRLRAAGVTDGDLRRLAERLLEPDCPD